MDEQPKLMTKEEYEKRKAKVLKLRRQVSTIVENLIEPDVNEFSLIEDCQYLCKNDYYDVTVERSILNYCGYPLCRNSLSSFSKKKQQYKICLQTHQVFDISDRKMFCSNLCFTRSNYLKEQLNEQPLWMRNLDEKQPIKQTTKINLYKKSKGGSFGDEIKLDLNLTKDLIEELHKEGDNLECKLYCKDCCNNKDQMKKELICKDENCKKSTTGVQLDKSINFPYIQEDDLTNLKNKLKNLKIKEKKTNLDNQKVNQIKNQFHKSKDEDDKIKPILDKVFEKMDRIKGFKGEF